MTRRLTLWLVPVLRRVIASDETNGGVRAEIVGPDEADYLLWATAAWLLVVGGTGIGSLIFPFLTAAWTGFNVGAFVTQPRGR